MKYVYRTLVFMTVTSLAIVAGLIAGAAYLIKLILRKVNK